MVGSCGRCAAAGRLPQRVSGHRAPSSPSAMAVAAVGRPRALRCPLLLLLSLLLVAGPALGWNDPDRILLRDVKALTLYSDRYTTSRRLDPIPQLKCVGGTAGCEAYTPRVIQCQNKGWDGYDVQVIATTSAAVPMQ